MVLVVVEVLYVVEQFLWVLRMFKDSLRGSRSHLKLL